MAKLCPTLYKPMDCNPLGSSAHGISQARILEWVAISFSKGSFPTQGLNPGLPHCRQTLYHLSHQGILRKWYPFSVCTFSQMDSKFTQVPRSECGVTFQLKRFSWVASLVMYYKYKCIVCDNDLVCSEAEMECSSATRWSSH